MFDICVTCQEYYKTIVNVRGLNSTAERLEEVEQTSGQMKAFESDW